MRHSGIITAMTSLKASVIFACQVSKLHFLTCDKADILDIVDDIEAACQRWEEKGVKWKKRMTDGRMKNIAFILDPDDYWIEVIQNETLKPTGAW